MNCDAHTNKNGNIEPCPEPATERLAVYLTKHPRVAVQRLNRCTNHKPTSQDWPPEHYTIKSHAIAEQKELPLLRKQL